MRKSSGEGTKIAQAAKELNVTSVTIRRYITEFNIDTTTDENGIKVLPPQAMEELFEIRRLKEEGLTNPKVMEMLEERRANADKPQGKDKAESPKRTSRKQADAPAARGRKAKEEPVAEAEPGDDEPEAEPAAEPVSETEAEAVDEPSPDEPGEEQSELGDDDDKLAEAGEGKVKHTLTCQTCNKVFEHMNPRLRDCLDCYRVKRKERRRGGDKHKTVIQNPIAQQVLSRSQQPNATGVAPAAIQTAPPVQAERAVRESAPPVQVAPHRHQVRSYRKAIEETRQITSNLKRRLERPDLPESERRFLEQIYAYQLILHQGWKHLIEYRSGGPDRSD